MDFIDNLRALAAKIANTRSMIQTEEATKNAMVMPLIRLLGYDVFDPQEVTPELIADVGMKKGEKVDYAILKDGEPIMLFECKKAGADLNISHASQLFRYFHVTKARFGVLTNGLVYKFFTDLEHANKMDEKPFFEFDMLDFKDRDVEELKKFAKASFDVDTILTTASDLKYIRAVQNRLADWMVNPSKDFVRLVASDLVGNRNFTPALVEQFTTITKRAFEQHISERINERLKGAMQPETTVVPSEVPVLAVSQEPVADAQIVTSDEEIEGFHIVRSIVRNVVSSNRVFMRDSKSYCAILLDDNNRKPICRFRFNNTKKLVLCFLNDKKEEENIPIETVDGIHDHAERLRAACALHLAAN